MMSVLWDLAEKVTNLAFAPAVVTANTGAGFFHLGVEAAAQTTRAGARLLEPFIPGARPIKVWNRDIGRRAEKERRRAFDLAFKGLKVGLLQLQEEDDDYLPENTSPGFNQLAADTAVGPTANVVLWPLWSALDFINGADEMGPVRDNLDLLKRMANATLDTFSVSGEHTRINTVDLRDHFISMTVGPGGAVVNDVLALFEGSLRLGLGNGKKLARAIRAGVDAMRYPVHYKDDADLLYPDIPINRKLYDAAKVIVDNEPKRFIEALEREDPLDAMRAAAEEPDKLVTFFFYYQWALSQVAVSVANFLRTGLRDVNDVEKYVLDEDDLLKDPEVKKRLGGLEDLEKQEAIYEELELRGKERPFTVTEFEFYVGNAKSKDREDEVAHLHESLPPGPFAQATINYAQETAFSYSSLLLQERESKPGSRRKALDRVQRLYGEEVRRRIQRDPSLKVIRFRKGLGQEIPETDLDAFIEREDVGGDWEDYYVDRIKLLEEYKNDPNTFLLESIRSRIDHRIAVLTEARRKLRLKARAPGPTEPKTKPRARSRTRSGKGRVGVATRRGKSKRRAPKSAG